MKSRRLLKEIASYDGESYARLFRDTVVALIEETEPTTKHEDDAFSRAPYWAQILNQKLNTTLAGLESIYRRIGLNEEADLERDEDIMSALTDAMDKLEANTTAIAGAEESAEAAFTRLAAMIADLKANTTDPATIQKIDALSTELANRAARLGAAVDATPT